jgi:hypothetical protein
MVLFMNRPFKHPKTHVYYFRKAVPADLRPILKRNEVKESLGTKDPVEARKRHAVVAARVERQWANLRAGHQSLTQRQIMTFAGKVYHDWVEALPEEPGETETWDHILRLQREAREQGRLVEWAGPYLDEWLTKEGLMIDRPDPLKIPVLKGGYPSDGSSWSRLLVAVHEAFTQASEVHRRRSRGDYSPDPLESRFPPASAPTALTPASRVERSHQAKGKKADASSSGGKRSMTGLVEDWWKEAKAAGNKPSTAGSSSRCRRP